MNKESVNVQTTSQSGDKTSQSFLASLLINLTSGDFYTYYEIEKKAYSENEEIQMKAINLMTVEH